MDCRMVRTLYAAAQSTQAAYRPQTQAQEGWAMARLRLSGGSRGHREPPLLTGAVYGLHAPDHLSLRMSRQMLP